MGVFCVNTKSKEFKETAKRLNIHPDSLEVYVHLFLNSIAANDYMEATDELPFPSDEQIREYFSLGNRESGTQAIDAWVENYGATDGFISASEVEDAISKYGTGSIHTYMNTAGETVHKVSRPNITSQKELKYFLEKLNIIDSSYNLLGISMDKFYERVDALAIPAELLSPIEMQIIKRTAINNGTFMTAPNGNATNLNEKQWLQVRTRAFKEWFGDWEKTAPKALKDLFFTNGEINWDYFEKVINDYHNSQPDSMFAKGRTTLATREEKHFTGEKNSLNHTKYVTQSMLKLLEGDFDMDLPFVTIARTSLKNQRELLLLAAMFHDAAKPYRHGDIHGWESADILRDILGANYDNRLAEWAIRHHMPMPFSHKAEFNTSNPEALEVARNIARDAKRLGIDENTAINAFVLINAADIINGRDLSVEDNWAKKAQEAGTNRYGKDISVKNVLTIELNEKVDLLRQAFKDIKNEDLGDAKSNYDTQIRFDYVAYPEGGREDKKLPYLNSVSPQVSSVSKVVDENGEPKVMLRTDDAGKTIMGREDGGAFFATDNLLVAGSYASDEADLYKGFINLKNPYIVRGESHGFFFEYKGKETTVQEAQPSLIDEGYDGVYFERTWDVGDMADVEPGDDYWANNVAMFNPNQIKSATDNVGTFSTVNDNIYYQKPITTQTRLLWKIKKSVKDIGVNNLRRVLISEGVDSNIADVIVEAVEKTPELAKFVPLTVFNIVRRAEETGMAADYNKYMQEPIIEELEKLLLEYLKPLHVEAIEDDVLEKYGVTGLYDILNKIIHIAKAEDRNAITVTEEFAHAFVELMGSRVSGKPENSDYTFLYNTIEQTSLYKQVYEQYKDTYTTTNAKGETVPDIRKIKKEAIGQALAVAINNKWKEEHPVEEKGFWQKLKDWFNSILKFFENADARFNKFLDSVDGEEGYINIDDLLNQIATEILHKNYDRLKKVDSKKYKLLDYTDTIAQQNKKDGGLALSFMQWYSSIGNIITGSLAYRRQGTVYRPSVESLHDIDMIVPLSVHGINLESNILQAALQQRGTQPETVQFLLNSEYFKKVLAQYPDLQITAAYSDNHGGIIVNSLWSKNKDLIKKFEGLSGTYADRLVHFTEEERNQMYLFDFFLEPTNDIDTFEEEDTNITLAKYPHIFEKKLALGRAKDIFDYQMWDLYEEFKSETMSSEEYLMFQKPIVYNPEQQEAIKQAGEYLADNEAAEDFFLITGPAGTGKTTIINEIIKNETARTGRTPSVYVTAVANKAVRTLSGKIDVKHTRRATATALGLQMSRNREGELEFKFPKKFDPNKIPIADYEIVIIDEASMLNTQSLKAVMQVKQMFPNKKFIMLGDINLLEGIEQADETEIINVFTYENKREARLVSRVRQGDTSPILPYSDEFRVDTIDVKQYQKEASIDKKKATPDDTHRTSIITKEGAVIMYKDSSSAVSEEILDSLMPMFEEAQKTKNPNLIKICAIHRMLVRRYNELIYKKLHPEENNPYNPLHKGDLIMFYNQFGKVTDPITNISEPLFFNSDEFSVEEVKKAPYQYVLGMTQEELAKLTRDKNAKLPNIYVQDIVIKKDGQLYNITVICPQADNIQAFKAYKSYLWQKANLLTDFEQREELKGIINSMEDTIAEINLGYAINVFKAQGSTYDTVVVDAKDIRGLRAEVKKGKSTYVDGFSVTQKLRGMYTAITRASNVTIVLRDRYAEESPIQDVKAINELINRNKAGEEVSDKEFETVVAKVQKTEKEQKTSRVQPIVSRTQAPIEEDTRTAMEIEDEKWNIIFEEHNNTIEFVEDSHDYWYYPQGKEHPESRVKMDTSVTTITNPVDRKYRDPKDGLDWLGVSSNIGSSADAVVRDFFMGIDITARKYPNFTIEQLKSLANDLKNFKLFLDKKFEGTKYRVVTNPFALVGKITKYNGTTQTVGGTLDILIYDEDGFYYIYDIKTSRNDLQGHSKLNNYTSQVNMYREMLEAMHPELKGCCGGLGILQLSTFYGTPKNLRFNGEDGTIMYTVDNAKQLQANGKPIEMHKEYRAPRFPGGDVQKAVIPVKESTPEQYYEDKRHKPLTISTLDIYRSSKKSKVQEEHSRLNNIERATLIPNSDKHFTGQVEDENIQQIVDGDLNNIVKTDLRVVDYYKRLKSGDLLELHNKAKDQSVLVKITKPLTKKGKGYQLEFEYVEDSYTGTPIQTGATVQTTSRTASDNLNEATVNKKTKKGFSANMWESYEDNKREGIASETTLDAIVNGERTATTRWKHIEGFYDQMKKGDLVEFHDNAGRSILVRVTKAPHKLTEDLDVEEWSKKEGWSTEYFENNVLEHIEEGEAYQLEYEYVEGSYVNPEAPSKSRITDITISYKKDKDNYKKGTPQKHKDTAYVFTENAQAHNKLEGKKTIGPDVFVITNVNAAEKGRFNQADIRTNAKGEKTENAFGIIVKKYQQNASRAFVAQEGCFENTDEDFELFKRMNLEMFENLEKSTYKKMIFPFEIALGKAALPKRFAEWLKNQLEARYGIITTIEKNTTPGYKGYGLRVSETKEATKGENISSKGSEFAKQLTNYGNAVSLEFRGKNYRNAEHAYQTWKSGEFDEVAYNSTAAKPKGSKDVNKKVSDSIMVDILTAKLQQHPELVKGITDRGGLSYINASTHDVIGDQHWETKDGKGDNGFIKALAQAYQNVTSKEVLFDEDGNPIDSTSEFDSHFTVSKGGYAQRTKENADWSDITLALATDFTTAGETLTAQQAGSTDEEYLGNRKPREGVEDKYHPISIANIRGKSGINATSYISNGQIDAQRWAKTLKIKEKFPNGIKLNIAGNGIYTLENNGYTQLEVNDYLYGFLAGLQQEGIKLEVRSGGLTGIDEAGIKAAQKLGIEWSVNAPKNWTFRVTKEVFNSQYKDSVSKGEYKENADDTVDIMNEQLFKERFIPENTSSTSIQKGQKQYNKEEEDKIESTISAMPEVNTISDKAPKGPLYTDYELELIKQREALNSLRDTDAIFKPSELSDLAKACMYLVSDFISEILSSKDKNEDWFKYLEDSPRKQQLLNTDFTTMDRIEICHKLGMTMYEVIRSKYFNAANNPNGANMKRSLRKKLTLINENWNAFLEMGQNVVARLEEIEFDNTRVHIVNEAEEVFDGQNLEEISEITGSAVEHWQVSFRLVSAHASLSQLIKRTLGTLFKIDENGEKVLNAFGIPKRVNESLAVNQILMWTQGSENLSQMVEKLREHEKQSPWLHQIISKLEDNSEDETFKAQFWSNFKKYFQPYIIQYQKPIIGPDGEPTGSILTNKVINLRSLEKQMLDDFVSLQQSRISEGIDMLLFNEDGTINQTIVKQYGEDLEKLKEYLDTYGENPEEAKAGAKVKAAIERLYRCLELELDEDTIESLADDYNVVKSIYSHALYIKTKRGLDAAVKNGTKDLDLTEQHRNDLESLFSYIVDNSTTTLESVSYEDGKLHYSYVTPSYLSNLIDKLKGNTEDYESFLEHNYGQYGWFKVGDQWRNEWLNILATDDSARRELQHAVVLTTRPVGSTVSVGYRDKSPMLYAKSMLLNYFYGGKKSQWAFYRIPIMSNKPSEEYVRFKRYIGEYYKDDLAELLVNVALQEIDRIATVRQRKSDDTTEEIKSFDKNGTKFLFLDYLQPILEEYLEWQKKHEGETLYYSEDEDGDIVNERLLLGQMLEQRIQGTENSDNETYFNDVITSVIKQSMREKFEDYLDDMRKEGLLEQDKEGNYIHLKDLLMLEGLSTEESLENFFWNDTFAAINILQLTVTDIAYYKNAEDLQKRLAQIHAPGLRGNVQAKWNGEVITDGKTRTIYVADFDRVVSDAIENIKQAFETKAQKLEKINPKEAEQFRELAKHIIEAFEDINVTDAQGYNSPSSYRKKAIAFGKWSDKLEDIYQKIRTGEYTTRDLEVMMQPLKPFVYSNATKSSVGRLGNLKVGMLNKNSEYLLLMMDAILKGEENSGNPTQSKLAAIYQVMEESHYDAEGNYKTDGIDTVQFNSTVKAGEMGVIDINNASTTQQAKTIIENAIYLEGNKLSGYNFDRVHVLEFEDYCIQNEVPAHLEGESIFGSQMRILSISDMPEMVAGVEQFINYRGKQVSLREVKLNYMKAIADNIAESMREIEKKFNIKGNRAERNIALSKLLQEQIKGDSRFGYDLLYSICTDEKGNFNIPLSDPINAGRVQQLLHSIIKTRINKLMIEGGPVVQVTNFGTSKELDIVFKDAQGNRLQTLREWFATQDFSDYGSPTYEEFAVMHRYKKAKEGTPEYDIYHNTYLPLRKIVSERYKEEVASKQAGIMYIECYAPSTVFKQFADENGVIDLDKIPDSMKELIGFRIPTEFKYSMAPLKIVGLLPSEAGEGIMLPKDITTLSGSDFDVDKLYIIRPVVKLDNFKLRQEYRKLQGKKYDVKAVWDDIYLNFPQVEEEIERAQKEMYQQQLDAGYTGSFEEFLEYAKTQGLNKKHKWLQNSSEVFNKVLEIWDDSEDYIIDNGIQMSFREFRNSKKGNAEYYVKIENPNSRDGRNNIIFDTIYAMLTSEQAMDLIFTPGNFDEPKQYGYMAEALRLHPEMSYEEVQKKFEEEGVDGLKDLIAKSKNLVYNNIHLAFHKQNMVAGKLIGIFAQNNVSHSIVSLIDQSVKTDANGNTLYDVNGKPKLWRPTIWIEKPVLEIEGDVIGGGEVSFDALEDKKGRRISNTLAAFLAASVDAVKDPVLNFMNINETTAGILTSLVRMGYDTELAMLFLTQPVIKDVIVKYAIENEEGYKSLDLLIQETIDTLNENDIDISNLTIPSLSKENLIKTLRTATSEENINLLRALQELNNISRVTSAIVSITKFNSVTAAAGPMLSNTMLMKQRVYLNLQMEELQTESMKHALNNPIIKAFRDTEFDAVDKLFEHMMLLANPQFDRIVTRVQEAINGRMDDAMVNKLSDFYLAFMLARGENPIFRTEDNDNPISETRRKYIYKSLPWEIKKLQKSSDNRFLKLLKVMPKDEAHEYYWLKINTRGMNGSVHDDVGLYWQELYQENPDIAMALIEYNFVTSGLGFTPNSFANLIPVALKRVIPNYIQLLGDPDSILNTEEEDRLIDQFIRNNHSNSKVVKKVPKIKKGSISFGNGYILISDNIANIRKDENNFYEYISYGGKLYKNKGVKADKVKYSEISKLGGKYGEILEINPSGEVEPIDLKPKKKTKKASEEKKDTKKRIDYSEDELFDDMVDDSKKKKSSISDAMIAQVQWFILNKVSESELKDRIRRLKGALAVRKTDKKAPENALRALFSKYSEEGYSQTAFSRMTDIGNIVYNAVQGLANVDQEELNLKIRDILDTLNDLNICG